MAARKSSPPHDSLAAKANATATPVSRPVGRPSREALIREFPNGPPDSLGLTARQRRILTVIRELVEERGYPPSMREIGESVGLTSSSSVSHQLRALEQKGYLRRDPNRPRALEVISPDSVPEALAADFEAATGSPHRPTSLSSGGSPPAARSSRSSRSRTSSRSHVSSSATARCSCSTSRATR